MNFIRLLLIYSIKEALYGILHKHCNGHRANATRHWSDVRSDILIAAVGRPRMITADMVRPGAIVIDVGVNRDSESGKLCGDVDFEAVKDIASHITPVPGGVGPMTITMLMQNTIECFLNRVNK